MGAYWFYTEETKNGKWIYYKVDGVLLKFLEHAYYDNPVVKFAIRRLYNQPRRAVWLCDYYEGPAVKQEDLTVVEVPKRGINVSYDELPWNLWFCSENGAINLRKALEIQKNFWKNAHLLPEFNLPASFRRINLFKNYFEVLRISPVPFMLASDERYAGGGDIDYPGRGRWAFQKVWVTAEKPADLPDITAQFTPILVEINPNTGNEEFFFMLPLAWQDALAKFSEPSEGLEPMKVFIGKLIIDGLERPLYLSDQPSVPFIYAGVLEGEIDFKKNNTKGGIGNGENNFETEQES